MSQNIPGSGGHYRFLPWLRQGIGGRINEVDRLGKPTSKPQSRASTQVSLFVKSDNHEDSTVEQELIMLGPGDVIGIDKNAIVRVAPVDGYYNFRPNYLPYIQFYDEDFPWRYTPAKATDNHRLRPWLALIVLKETEFKRRQLKGSPLPAIEVFNWNSSTRALPPADQSWAWAHVQTHPKHEQDNILTLIEKNPNQASSRIISPRKLLPNEKYYAFLVPAFEQGRLAGLGGDPQAHILPTDVQLHSWEKGIEHQFQAGHWPVYYEWHFKTGTRGDFEYLARLIKPRSLDPKIGKRLLDIQAPGHQLHYPDNNGAILMDGALLAAETTPAPFPLSLQDNNRTISSGEAQFLDDLENLLNQNTETPDDETEASDYDDPFILPPLYGQWPAQKDKVSSAGMKVGDAEVHWHDTLNLDPRYRAIAGLGAQVVQKDQDQLMDKIWDRFREWWLVNQHLKRYQFSQQMGVSMFARHVSTMEDAQLLSLTAGIHSQIRIGHQNQTIYSQFPERSFATPAFRRLTRASGSIMKRMAPEQRKQIQGTHLLNKALAPGFMQEVAYVSPENVQAVAGVVDQQALATNITSLMQRYGIAENQLKDFLVSFVNEQGQIQFTNIDNPILVQIDPTIGIGLGWGQILQPGSTVFSRSVRSRAANNLGASTRAGLEPMSSHAQRVAIASAKGPNEEITPLQLHLEFHEHMYAALADHFEEDFIPNLDLIPPNTFGLMVTNQAFVEAYMAGINHEFNRELLWREFPGDAGATYFRQFWENSAGNLADADTVAKYKSIEYMHLWKAKLGQNRPSTTGDQNEDLVFVIRGELLKAYPNPMIYMQQAEIGGFPVRKRFATENTIWPIFEARIEPDIYFFGFDITLKDAIGNKNNPNVAPGAGWYLVVEERPGELNFGLDMESNQETANDGWANLSWDDIGIGADFDGCVDLNENYDPDQIRMPPEPKDPDEEIHEPIIYWGKGDKHHSKAAKAGLGHAADMAHILYQPAFRLNIHASMLVIKPEANNG